MLLERTAMRTLSIEPPRERPQAIRTLDQLNQWHRRLLLLSQAGSDDALASETADFLQEGIALGTLLDLPRQREEAQAMLDYWAGSSAIAAARQNKLSFAGSPRIFSPVLAPFAAAEVDSILEAADARLAQFDEADRERVRRLLLRLTCLSPDGRSHVRQSATRDALLALGEPGRAEQIIEALLDAGVLHESGAERVREPGTVEVSSSRIEIAHEAFLRRWRPFQEWLAGRQRLRRAAEDWRDHGKDPAVVFEAGRVLDEAESYGDLDDLEREFARASRARHASEAAREAAWARREAVRLRWLVLVLLLVAAVASFAYVKVEQAWAVAEAKENEALASSAVAKEQMKRAIEAASDAHRQTIFARAAENDARVAREEAESARAEVESEKVKALAALEKASQSLKLAEESAEVAKQVQSEVLATQRDPIKVREAEARIKKIESSIAVHKLGLRW